MAIVSRLKTPSITANRSLALIGALLLFGLYCGSWITQRVETKAAVPADTLAPKQIDDAYGRIEMSFESNKGQAGRSVDYVARGAGYALLLKPNEAVFALTSPEQPKAAYESALSVPSTHKLTPSRKAPSILRFKLVGANPKSEAEPAEELPGKVNYFIGNDPAKWQTNISTHSRVRYREVYKGIDIEYYGNQRQLEYDFHVAPGADYRQISLQFTGVDSLRVDEETGDLVIYIKGQTVRQHKPVVYQDIDGVRRKINGSFVLSRKDRVRFDIGDHDHDRPLVIEPVLVYSTYLGGFGVEGGNGIAIDASGNAYITGGTTSTNFPMVNPLQGTKAGTGNDTTGNDVFITKLNANGSAIIYSTYLGGGRDDVANAVAIDTSGNAYVTGRTTSTDFPTASPVQALTGSVGNNDAFVAKLNGTGTALIYSTFLGGDYEDIAYGIAVDPSGSAYVAGDTGSSNFPTVNPLQGSPGHFVFVDGFVTKVDPSGSAFVYSTYLGGSGTDHMAGIAVDGTGQAFVTGVTESPNFPTFNPIQGTNITQDIRSSDAFVSKINAGGSGFVYSTHLGGTGGDGASAIAIDTAGNAYVTGNTVSTNFPLVAPYQSGLRGGGMRSSPRSMRAARLLTFLPILEETALTTMGEG